MRALRPRKKQVGSFQVGSGVLALLLFAMTLGLIWIYLAPVACTVAPENLVYFKLGGFFFLGWTGVCLLTGVVTIRSTRTYRADEPISYWFILISMAMFGGCALYPVYYC